MKKEKTGLNILDIVTTKAIYIEEQQSTLDCLKKEIEELKEDEKVKEYLRKLDELSEAKIVLNQKLHEYQGFIIKKCSHPLFNMVCGVDYQGYPDYNNGQVECVLCEKRMDFNLYDIKELYKNKRLIAKYSRECDDWEGRSWDEFKPSLLTSSGIRKYYYELFLKYEYLKSLDDEEVFSEFNVEDLVWQHYCNSQKEKSLKKTKTPWVVSIR